MLPSMSGWELLDRALEKLDRLNDPVMIVPAINGKTGYPSTLGVAGWFTKTLDVPLELTYRCALGKLSGSTTTSSGLSETSKLADPTGTNASK